MLKRYIKKTCLISESYTGFMKEGLFLFRKHENAIKATYFNSFRALFLHKMLHSVALTNGFYNDFYFTLCFAGVLCGYYSSDRFCAKLKSAVINMVRIYLPFPNSGPLIKRKKRNGILQNIEELKNKVSLVQEN